MIFYKIPVFQKSYLGQPIEGTFPNASLDKHFPTFSSHPLRACTWTTCGRHFHEKYPLFTRIFQHAPQLPLDKHFKHLTEHASLRQYMEVIFLKKNPLDKHNVPARP
jgi:hypothetical protein